MVVEHEFEKLKSQFVLFIAAAETEDELGTVLRLHLLAEAFLESVLELTLSSEVKRFTPNMRNFADKLGYAAVSGLPTPLAAVVHQVNIMRNKLAHRDSGGINAGDAKQLGRLVDALPPIGYKSDRLGSIEKAYLELPVKSPSVRILFGSGNLRADFIMCFAKFWQVAMPWLAMQVVSQTKDSSTT